MPNYSAGAITSSLYIGDIGVCFNAETPTPAQASQAFAIKQTPFSIGFRAISVECSFGGAPGAYEVDMQESDTDADAFYQNIAGGAFTTVSSNNTVRADLQVKCKFVRALLKTRTNSVTCTVKING